MSSETQSHSRKRRDRKKKKGDSELDKLDIKNSPDINDEDDSCRDDVDEHESNGKSHHDDHSHGPASSPLSTVIFFLLLGGLVILTSMIFLELKGSKEVGPPIAESRYASILGDFVDEHAHEEDDHDMPQMYSEDEEHENEEDLDHGGGEEVGGEKEVGEEEEGGGDGEEEEGGGDGEEGEGGEEEGVEQKEGGGEEAGGGDQRGEDETGGEVEDVEVTEGEVEEVNEHLESESAADEQAEVPSAPADAEAGGDETVLDDVSDQAGLQDDGQLEDASEVAVDEVGLEQEVELGEQQANLDVESETENGEDQEQETEPEVHQENVEVEEEAEQEDHREEEVIEEGKTEQDSSVIDANEKVPEEEQIEAEIETDLPVEELLSPSGTEEEIGVRENEKVEEELDDAAQEGLEDNNIEERTETLPVQGSTRDDLTDSYDYEFQEELDAADAQLENSRVAKQTVKAKEAYDEILRKHPASPRALYGLAMSYDKLSEQQNSNALLEQSIRSYQKVLESPNVTDPLFRLAGERCVDRMRFRGFIEKAIEIQAALIRRFPRDSSLQNQLAVSHLLLGQTLQAKKVLEEVLNDFPKDGFAKVHYGFILKTSENKIKEAIRYLKEGIESLEPGTIDGRFYFHLGDALMREGLAVDAFKIYEEGVRRGLFLSVYQRSLYNVDGLTGRAWWTLEETTYGEYLKKLEDNWLTIREEGLALLDEKKDGFLPETENLRDTGTWKQFEIYSRGKKIAANCAKAPRTCQLVGEIPDAAGCKRGQVKFSIMHPGTHVWPHTGPTNCRIRAHLGLVVPDGVKIRVANETRFWAEGKFIVFDDSFEHEVWHAGQGIRLVLIVDFWHPELTRYQKETMTPI